MKPLSKNIPKEKTAHTFLAPTTNTHIRHVQVTFETKKSERKHLKEICATFYLLTETTQTQLPLHNTCRSVDSRPCMNHVSVHFTHSKTVHPGNSHSPHPPALDKIPTKLCIQGHILTSWKFTSLARRSIP